MKKLATLVFASVLSSTAVAGPDWSAAAGLSALQHSANNLSNTSVRVSLQTSVAMRVSNETRLGMGVEILPMGYSEADYSNTLLTWRVAELSHDLSNRFRIRGYAGASRYQREATGLGISFGVGVDYKLKRFSRWDIGAEISYTSTDVSYDTGSISGRSKFDNFLWASAVLRYRF